MPPNSITRFFNRCRNVALHQLSKIRFGSEPDFGRHPLCTKHRKHTAHALKASTLLMRSDNFSDGLVSKGHFCGYDTSCSWKICCCTMPPAPGIASTKDASGKRTYWVMVITGDYEPKPSKGKRQGASCGFET